MTGQELPVLFVNGDLDQMNTIKGNRLGEPMRASCADLTVTSLPGAHWLPLECKAELVGPIRTWLRRVRGTTKSNSRPPSL